METNLNNSNELIFASQDSRRAFIFKIVFLLTIFFITAHLFIVFQYVSEDMYAFIISVAEIFCIALTGFIVASVLKQLTKDNRDTIYSTTKKYLFWAVPIYVVINVLCLNFWILAALHIILPCLCLIISFEYLVAFFIDKTISQMIANNNIKIDKKILVYALLISVTTIISISAFLLAMEEKFFIYKGCRTNDYECIASLAVKENNPDICKKTNGKWVAIKVDPIIAKYRGPFAWSSTGACYNEYAIIKGDTEKCGEYHSEYCFWTIAAKNKNPNICKEKLCETDLVKNPNNNMRDCEICYKLVSEK